MIKVIKCAIIGFILGAIIAIGINAIMQFEKDSRDMINQFKKPVMVMGAD